MVIMINSGLCALNGSGRQPATMSIVFHICNGLCTLSHDHGVYGECNRLFFTLTWLKVVWLSHYHGTMMPSKTSYPHAISHGSHRTAKSKDAKKTAVYREAQDGYELSQADLAKPAETSYSNNGSIYMPAELSKATTQTRPNNQHSLQTC